MTLASAIKRHGIIGTAHKACQLVARKISHSFYRWSVRNAPKYNDPNDSELTIIERDMQALGLSIQDYAPHVDDFLAFKSAGFFPTSYHGGIDGPVWDEKLLEHFIAADRLGVMAYNSSDIYIDVAAGSSPWVKSLREHLNISAFAIDLFVSSSYENLPFYKQQNATATTFADSSVTGVSLQCAYEMFAGNDDTDLIKELARILKPGGKATIVPLYLHTHYCSYSTPEYFSKGKSDPLAKEYVCYDWSGIPSARFYDVIYLKKRVLDTITRYDMKYQILALRNKTALGNGIYCHFILEITK